MRRLGRMAVVLLLSAALVPPAVAVTVVATLLLAPLPAVLPTSHPEAASEPSRVYLLERNGTRRQIGVFRQFDQRIPVDKADVPKVLEHAVVAAEDRNFYEHGGLDPIGIARALIADIRNQGLVQGGSTITQQYVRDAYLGHERTIGRKVRETILARQLDRQTDKGDILFAYLSRVYLGGGAYGVGAASETYFRKPVSQVTISEAALLAGLIPAPSRYEPRGDPMAAESKRRLVLHKMRDQGYIDDQQLAVALAEPVWLASRGQPPGPATLVYPPGPHSTEFPYFVDYVRRYLLARYGPTAVFRGGLDITVTLDPAVQRQAEAAVGAQLEGTRPPLEMSLVAVEPSTGYVKALVGGRDFEASQVNLALGGCPSKPREATTTVEVEASCWEAPIVEGGGTGRQPASAFKPFVLTTALSKGIPPTKVYPAPRVFRIPSCRSGGNRRTDCTIGNSEGSGGGRASVRDATVSSINTVYAQLVRDAGCKDTAETAKKLGITSAWYSPQFHTCSGTYALGVIDVSPLDMASAFGVFAARGRRFDPTPVLVVTGRAQDGKRKVLEDNRQPEGDQVLSEPLADTVSDVLQGVIASGTGRSARFGRPAAGKTGTADNFTNAWFVGYTPNLSTAVWMGHADNQSTPLVGIKGTGRVFGGTIPAQTWRRFMAAVLHDVPVTEFSEPPPGSSLSRVLRDEPGDHDGPRLAPGARRPVVPTRAGGPYQVKEPLAPLEVTPPTTVAGPPDSPAAPAAGGASRPSDMLPLLPG